jgi:hypothetical protein
VRVSLLGPHRHYDREMTGAGDVVRVLLVETFEADELGPIATGRFNASALSRTERPIDYAEELPLDEALAWGRARAQVVEVRLSGFGEQLYSAGAAPSQSPPLSEAPDVRRRRAAGWEFLDRTEADEPIIWDVVVMAALRNDLSTEAEPRLRVALHGEPGVARHEVLWVASAAAVSANPTTGPGTRYIHQQVAVLRLQARTARQAIDVANSLTAEALATANIPLTDLTDANIATWQNQVYATGSRAAEVNLRRETLPGMGEDPREPP